MLRLPFAVRVLRWVRLFGAAAATVGLFLPGRGADVRHIVPVYQYTQALVAADDRDERRYLAFPVSVGLGYKRDFAHAVDRFADVDLLRLDPRTERVCRQEPALHPSSHGYSKRTMSGARPDMREVTLTPTQ